MRQILVLFGSLTFLLISCSPLKKVESIHRDYSQEEILTSLANHNHEFTWFHSKAKAQIRTSTMSHNADLVIRMLKDSAVWVQIKKFEIELARMLISPTDYTILYRLETAYETSSLDKIRDMVGMEISFDDVQQWMFGNIPLPETDLVSISQNEENVLIQFSTKDWRLAYVLDKNTLLLKNAEIRDRSDRILRIQWEDYKKSNNGINVAYSRTIFFPEEPGVTGVIKLDFTEIELDVPKELKFVIPSHYGEYE
ncbi:MAG: DUF4292 domain-containing protein [Saprospiraceae bacterium]